jgi:hypothetical protein
MNEKIFAYPEVHSFFPIFRETLKQSIFSGWIRGFCQDRQKANEKPVISAGNSQAQTRRKIRIRISGYEAECSES